MRQALQQCIEALRKAVVLLAGAGVHAPAFGPDEAYEAVSDAIAAAQAALDAPQPEPVAWLYTTHKYRGLSETRVSVPWDHEFTETPLFAAPPDVSAMVAERDALLALNDGLSEENANLDKTIDELEASKSRLIEQLEKNGALMGEAADRIDALLHERDAAFKMSRCECGSDEACANLAKLLAENDALQQDAARIDWIARQDLQDLSMGIVIDAPHDGDYYVRGDNNVPGYGPTFRAAIDAAMSGEQK